MKADYQEIKNMKELRVALMRERAKAPQSLEQFRLEFETINANIPLPDGCKTVPIGAPRVSGYCITPSGCDTHRALLYHHGGGHTFGSPESHRHLVGRLAEAARVVGFDMFYRLAPEYPYPAALEDALENYRWLLGQGFKPENIIIGGESAGGNVTVALALMIRERGLPQPAGMYLLSPWLDLRHQGVSHSQMKEADVILNMEFVERCAAAYCGKSSARDDPFVSPLLAELKGLPPTMIQVGTSEILLSDSLDFAAAAALAEMDVTLRIWPGQIHCWPIFHPAMPESAGRAIEEAAAWISQCLAGTLR
ncbi:alpha/beta hydrolase [Tardiphaga sp. 215_C5_N2_1]|uniref:alpha/beta hydrolase n=1 Tax=Tardiphaga sp. 215_C5_N2_1 TaxID=3240774 RepID=UPI003F8C4411